MNIGPDWIDYNGHLNMAYYNVLFMQGMEDSFPTFGLGEPYMKRTNNSTMTAEVHIHYIRELHIGSPVRSTVYILEVDAKRMRVFQQLIHADEGWLSATMESMQLHVDMSTRRVAPWPTNVLKVLRRLQATHTAGGMPDGTGRRIVIPTKNEMLGPTV